MKKLTKFLLIILGIILLNVFIWSRFIRTRLPREIPFSLTEFSIIILILVCITYLIIVTSLIFKTSVNNELMTYISGKIYKPLEILNDTIKTSRIIKPYYDHLLSYMVTILKKANYTYLYVIFQIHPLLILAIALCIDTFYFNCIFLLYKCIFVSVLLIINKDILYWFKRAKELYILHLEYMLEGISTDYNEDNDSMFGSRLDPRDFIEKQTDSIVYNKHAYTFGPLISEQYDNDFCKAHDLPINHRFTTRQRAILNMEFYAMMDIVIPLSVYIEEFEIRHKFPDMRYRKLIIFSLYLICWLYILCVSFHTLPINSFSWLWIIQNNIEPFCDILLKDN